MRFGVERSENERGREGTERGGGISTKQKQPTGSESNKHKKNKNHSQDPSFSSPYKSHSSFLFFFFVSLCVSREITRHRERGRLSSVVLVTGNRRRILFRSFFFSNENIIRTSPFQKKKSSRSGTRQPPFRLRGWQVALSPARERARLLTKAAGSKKKL